MTIETDSNKEFSLENQDSKGNFDLKAMRVANGDRLLYIFNEFFVNRADTYGLQSPAGSYTRIEQPLTTKILRKHFRGEKTVGFYQLDEDNMVKWLVYDLDPEHIENPNYVASKIVNACLENNRFHKHAVWLEASRHPDPSYHIWVLFTPKIQATVAKWLGQRILAFTGVDPRSVELFPKQTSLTESRPFGNLVKAPLGLHQKAKKWSCFLDHKTLQPLPSEALTAAWGCNLSEQDLAKIKELAGKEKGLQTRITFDLPESFEGLEDGEENWTANFLAKYWVPGYRNQLELSFLGLCLKRGVSFESAYRIIDQVTRVANDEERGQRLDLVKYHYKQRRTLGSQLKGVSSLRELVKELVKE